MVYSDRGTLNKITLDEYIYVVLRQLLNYINENHYPDD